MKNEILYVGIFKFPDKNAAAIVVRGVADALNAVGYTVTFIPDNYAGPKGTDRTRPPLQRLSTAVRRGFDILITSSTYFKQLESVDWQRVAVTDRPGVEEVPRAVG